jgi:hypothetical protein
LDVVFVVGLAEELVPGRLREDALLPERVRALAPGQLAPLRDRQHRQLLAALEAPNRIVSFPGVTCAEASVRLRRKRNGNPPGAAFFLACSIRWDGTRQPTGV